MAFVLQIKPKARKNLDKLPRTYRLRIRRILREIASDPFSGKKLSGKRKDQYSIRVWPYRIIYIIKKMELIVFVIDIDHRQGVYK
ncbi:type II toxin-antitoxin system RelE/ParE family toxin [Patescibacteria group bacterium]|nr:type II toxin-antitoxin system RelE/ParE family toxin [Patescibacteria group bacterium]